LELAHEVGRFDRSGSLALGVTTSVAAPPRQAAFEVPAEIIVRPQVSIAEVRFGDSERAVEARLEAPVRVRPDEQPGPIVYEHWFYRGLKIGLVGYPQRLSVLIVQTSSPTARTPRGVGIGSSGTRVRRDYPSARCSAHRRVITCAIGEPGSRQTGFEIRDGTVRAIWLGDVF
jgi:hypothetical protein